MAQSADSAFMSFHQDAFICRNASLRQFIKSNRHELRKFLSEVQNEMRDKPESRKFGERNSDKSILIDRNTNCYLGDLIVSFERCLEGYEIYRYQIWYGTGEPTAVHLDTPAYLNSGQSVAMQFWVPLDSYMIGNEDLEPETEKNFLECLLPIAPGLTSGMYPDALTPNGVVRYQEESVVGGDNMSLGDLLVFKNGVLHRSQGSEKVFRAALVFRAFRTADKPFYDENLKRWFKDFLTKNPEVRDRMKQVPGTYFQTVLNELEDLPPGEIDYSKLAKIDRNDVLALKKNLEEFCFTMNMELANRSMATSDASL